MSFIKEYIGVILFLSPIIILPAAAGIFVHIRMKRKEAQVAEYTKKGNECFNEGRYNDAHDFYFKLLNYASKHYGNANPKTVPLLMGIAKIYFQINRPEKALEYVLGVKDYYEVILENNDTEKFAYYTLMGNLKDKMGLYNEALAYYQKIFDMCKEIGKAADVDYAKCCLNTAIALDHLGMYGDAWVNYTTAIRTFENADGDYLSLISLSYFNLGISSFLQKKYDESLSQLNKALEIRLKINRIHPNTARCYHFIGCSHHESGHSDKAMDSLLEALYIRLKTIGNEHPHYAETYNKIKQVYLESNLPEEDFTKWIENKLDEYFDKEGKKAAY